MIESNGCDEKARVQIGDKKRKMERMSNRLSTTVIIGIAILFSVIALIVIVGIGILNIEYSKFPFL